MNEDIKKNVVAFVDFVFSYANALAEYVSFDSGKREPIKDLIQAKAVFVKAARKIDLSSQATPKQEMVVEGLFMRIQDLQDGRYESDNIMISALGFSYYEVGFLIARFSRNWELSELGKSGAGKRYTKMRELEAWTLSEYRRGNWKSANQAAHALKDAVLAQSRTLEANLTESNAQRTIAEWINKDKKRSSRQADTLSGCADTAGGLSVQTPQS